MAYITSAERIGIQKGIQQGLLQGMQQGLQQGRQEGRQEGEYSLLTRLLERKFKVLPENCRKRLMQADAETLLVWGERIIDATTLEDVFADRVE